MEHPYGRTELRESHPSMLGGGRRSDRDLLHKARDRIAPIGTPERWPGFGSDSLRPLDLHGAHPHHLLKIACSVAESPRASRTALSYACLPLPSGELGARSVAETPIKDTGFL